jgi:hypothetical protein
VCQIFPVAEKWEKEGKRHYGPLTGADERGFYIAALMFNHFQTKEPWHIRSLLSTEELKPKGRKKYETNAMATT